MKKLLTFALLAAVTLAGCNKYDDSELRRLIDDHEKRLTALETLTGQLGDRIDAKASITAITELPGGAGWRITFSKGDPIEVRHGSKGEKGDTGSKGEKGDRGSDGGGDSLIASIVPDEANGTVTINLADGRSFTFPSAETVAAGVFDLNGTTVYVWSGVMEYYGDYYETEGETENVLVTLPGAAGGKIGLDFLLEPGETRLTEGIYDFSDTIETGILYDGDSGVYDKFGNGYTVTGGTVEVYFYGSGDAAMYVIDVDLELDGGISLTGNYKGTLTWIDESE